MPQASGEFDCEAKGPPISTHVVEWNQFVQGRGKHRRLLPRLTPDIRHKKMPPLPRGHLLIPYQGRLVFRNRLRSGCPSWLCGVAETPVHFKEIASTFPSLALKVIIHSTIFSSCRSGG